MTTVLRYDELLAAPWRNGLGTTREVASSPGEGEFHWRVSIAEIVAAAGFSAFEGVDRTLTMIDGDELRLDVAGAEHRLRVGDAARFDGEAAVEGTPVGGRVLALNLMNRRGRTTGSAQVVHLAAGDTLDADLVCALGPVELGDGVRLAAFDCALLDGPVRARSGGQVVRIDIAADSQVRS
ncbi:HutD/Ves family protein [Luteipulveratus halotolerans]|uniref:HutD/Ves family protein n=1 Tax=Luteipulveratus halotolerans TaxID=1631356 RepID=UPI00068218EF|nr:HutD family protein [Luteipulveratus halotolerans]